MGLTPFTTGSPTSLNSCTEVLVSPKTAGCAGTLLQSQRGLSYLWRLRYSYDSALADRHSVGRRRTGVGSGPLECLSEPLDFVDRGERGFRDRTYRLVT